MFLHVIERRKFTPPSIEGRVTIFWCFLGKNNLGIVDGGDKISPVLLYGGTIIIVNNISKSNNISKFFFCNKNIQAIFVCSYRQLPLYKNSILSHFSTVNIAPPGGESLYLLHRKNCVDLNK